MPSTAIAIDTEAWQTAVARSVIYAFLSRAFAYPTPEHQAMLREQIAPALFEMDGDGELAESIHAALGFLDAPIEELRAAHTNIFTMTVSADCPDYETAYDSKDIFQQTHSMADIAGFYQANGLVVGGRENQRPDHIATELEFMGFMATKEAYALQNLGPTEVSITQSIESIFLRDHLACWGPALGRRLQALGGDTSFLGSSGRLLAIWLLDECDRLGVVPARTLEEPLLEWPEPDDGSCGAEGSCPIIGLDEIPVAGGS